MLPTMQAWLPAGVKLQSFFDRTPTIRASLHDVQATLLISLVHGDHDDGRCSCAASRRR